MFHLFHVNSQSLLILQLFSFWCGIQCCESHTLDTAGIEPQTQCQVWPVEAVWLVSCCQPCQRRLLPVTQIQRILSLFLLLSTVSSRRRQLRAKQLSANLQSQQAWTRSIQTLSKGAVCIQVYTTKVTTMFFLLYKLLCSVCVTPCSAQKQQRISFF